MKKIFSILFSRIPIPVSVTANSTVAFSSSSFSKRTLTVIFPLFVNLIALVVKLYKIYFNLK